MATLNAGQFYETILTAASEITANNPIQVMQYSNGQSYDSANADPFDITIAPYAQFLNSYTVTTEPDGADPAITSNYINVVAPTSEVGNVTLDAAVIASSDFTAIGGTGFSGAQVPVPFGSHVLNGPLPFGVTV
ncbi:MAG TPA: IgGFc-binding protein [Trebonia sp.]|nr:IgGFc-binding protein [Trebonia sp.]